MLPSELNTDGISIRLDTDYPFRNQARYTIEADKPFSFRIRIPSFAEQLRVNGEERCTEEQVFAIQPGKTEITLSFETPAHYISRPHDLYAVQAGSLVFSLPIEYEKTMKEYVDKAGVERKFPYCDYEIAGKSEWRYAFENAPLEVEYRGIDSEYPFSETKPAVVLKAKLSRINWELADGYEHVPAPKPASPKAIADAEDKTLHPYGCSRLRMTEMPFALRRK
jgi:hypothetical protein